MIGGLPAKVKLIEEHDIKPGKVFDKSFGFGDDFEKAYPDVTHVRIRTVSEEVYRLVTFEAFDVKTMQPVTEETQA